MPVPVTRELITLIGKRLLHPGSAVHLGPVSLAIGAQSPMLAKRYERALIASGALENPDTTPDERELLLDALSGEPARESRTNGVRLRLSPSELAAVREAASDAGDTVGAYIRRHLPCLAPGE